MGRTARFDQIYVASLDAQPVEEETLTGVKSILTKEIEADEIAATRFTVANTSPTKNITIGDKLFIDKDDLIVFDLKERGRASRMFIDEQFSIGTTNPTKVFQINSGETTKVSVDLSGKDLMTVDGNTVTTNLIFTNEVVSAGGNVVINGKNANVVTIRGNLVATNALVTSNLNIGSNILLSDEGSNIAFIYGNVYQEGYLNLVGNIAVTGNVTVTDTARYEKSVNLVVDDPIILAGAGNGDGTNETGFMMTPGLGYSNVAMAFTEGNRGREIAFFQTDDFVEITNFTPDTSKTVNVHVYGDIYTSSNIGASNINPTHDLCVGDKFFVDTSLPADSNVLEVDGFTYTKGLKLGPLGLQVGTAVTLNPAGVADPTAAIINLAGNFQGKGLRTSGETPWNSGIANTNPQDTFAIGTQITSNLQSGNTWYVYGNTYTSNLLTDFARITGDIRIGGPGVTTQDATRYIKSDGQLVIHANDSSGDNDTSNSLILKSGTEISNVSSIEISSASTKKDNQYITFNTKNTERLRITGDGKIGFKNTAPSSDFTISAPVIINFSNALTIGNVFGVSQQTSLQLRSRPNSYADTFIESHVGTGKGMKFGVTSTGTMGDPKMTIMDTGGVGIGVTTPHGILNTSGGTVFINRQVTTAANNNYDHTLSPLVVTSQNQISAIEDPQPVMILSREATSEYGAKSVFELERWQAGASRTRMNIKLAHDSYDDVNIMSLRSDGRVGIGKSNPTAPLEIKSTGAGNPNNNGLVVYNPSASEGQDSIITVKASSNKSDAFSAYTDDNNQGWSIGMTDRTGNRDFRITNNIYAVSNVLDTALFIDGITSNVGIGTDITRGKLTVNGDVRVGNELSFGGVEGDDGALRHHTFMLEQKYGGVGDSTSELFIFKGNDGVSRAAGAGPDRIRHVAAEHRFQVYDNASEIDQGDLVNIIDDTSISGLFNKIPTLMVSGNERVLVYTDDEEGIPDATKLYVNGVIQVPKEQSFSTGGMEFKSSDADTNNIINSLSVNRDFVFQVKGTELARLKNTGRLGIGTDTPSSNLHVYDGKNSDTDVLTIESVSPASGVSKTGIVIHKSGGYGGYIRGYRDRTNSTAGLIFGGEYGNSETDAITILKSTTHSNVGIGTTTPTTGFHLYNKKQKIQTTGTSNAVVEFVTNAGLSDIYASNTGNVHINPVGSHLKIDSDVDITGDLTFSGQFELGSQVGINLAGSDPQTNLHVRGGVITNDDEVACKRYSKTFSVNDSTSKNVQLMFGNGAFYAKIVAILRHITSGAVQDVSTMIIEVQGGTSNGSTPTRDITLGTRNLFGGTNSYPWSKTVTPGRNGINIVPYNISNDRRYSYDIYVELTSACGGKLTKITRDIGEPINSGLLDGTGGNITVATFTY